MTTPVASSMAFVSPDTPAYRTKTSFVSVHFDELGNGRIVFLPKGATLQVIGRSSCLPTGFEVVFEKCSYNVFEIDLTARSTLVRESGRAKRRPMVACA
jgi:hypothetical protein